MLEITYWQMLTFITIVWIIMRVVLGIKRQEFRPLQELKLLMVYICIIVIARIVYFPWHHVNGHIDTLQFDVSKIIPPKVNLIPIVRLFEVYDGWQMNIIGNITMFIPVGIVWPVCFKKLDSLGKTILAGGLFSLCIEITQLLFYSRCSDVDDLILNTSGVVIGAIIYFGIRWIASTIKSSNRG